jgi:2'-5' RNA ligase
MRLFVAIDLPPGAREALGVEQQRIARSLGNVRLVKPGQMHVTLVFLGELADPTASAVTMAMNEDVSLPPFEIVFGGIGAFPPRGAPRAFWIGITNGVEATVALQRVLSERIAALGVPLEDRPFSPHLTLGRWRESKPSDRKAVESASSVVRVPVRVERASLYRSTISSAGPTYTALAHATLRG